MRMLLIILLPSMLAAQPQRFDQLESWADSLFLQAEQQAEARAFEEALQTLVQIDHLLRTSDTLPVTIHARLGLQYGVIYHKKGDYPMAESWLLEAKTHTEHAFGSTHAQYGACLFWLGVVYYHWGNNYKQAERYLLEAKAIQAAFPDAHRLDYSHTLLYLGNIYYFTGNYVHAEEAYEACMRIRLDVLGPKNLLYAECLRKLGNIKLVTGDFGEAEALYLSSLDALGRDVGQYALPVADIITNLGWLNLERGNYPAAQAYLVEATSIYERQPQCRDIPGYMSCLDFMGGGYYMQDDFLNAEQYLLAAKELRETKLGKDHLSVEMSYVSLADLYWKMGSQDQAAHCFAEAARMRKAFLAEATHHFSEREVAAYITYFEGRLDKHYSFASETLQTLPSFAGNCYDNILFHKGFLLNASLLLRDKDVTDPALAQLLQNRRDLQKQISIQLALPAGVRNDSLLAAWEGEENGLDKHLATLHGGLRKALQPVDWKAVQAALQTDEAAVEFIRYRFFNKATPTDSILYAALVLRPGHRDPTFVPLFEERELTALLPQRNKGEYINQLYHDPTLAKLIWQPITEHLQDARKVYYASAGLLYRFQLAALTTGDGKVVADAYDLVMLRSTRDLLDHGFRNRQCQAIQPSCALLYGAIEYDEQEDGMPYRKMNQSPSEPKKERGLDFALTNPEYRKTAWAFLPNSAREIQYISALFRTQLLPYDTLGEYAATEESFKQLGVHQPSPGLIHLSTHGYFFPDPSSKSSNPAGDDPAFVNSKHPLIRSGLILAGANRAWLGDGTVLGREDGILTAYEISQLDLSETELAVLSACETGLGDIVGNEGVYGLQRAFRIAGVKNVLMSLWQVPDYPTQELMTLFYKKWIGDKLPIHQALKAAQKAMRDKGYEPYQWAGWVLMN